MVIGDIGECPAGRYVDRDCQGSDSMVDAAAGLLSSHAECL